MKIKAIITITETKPDMYGNTYRTATVSNARTGQQTPTFKANSEGNVLNILSTLLDCSTQSFACSVTRTESARFSSLPVSVYYKPADLAKELRKIGFSVPIPRVSACMGCL